MKNFWLLMILFFLFGEAAATAQTTRKKLKSVKKPVAAAKSKKKSIAKGVVVSRGVYNSKAINLVKPVFSTAARAVRAEGEVAVRILIDEEGRVVEAEAYSGHALLRPSAVAAALRSTFVPMMLRGHQVKVRTVIIYNYVLDSYNWLEIGSAVRGMRFVKMLPFGFDEERLMSEQYEPADHDDRVLILQSILSSVENKLSGDRKSLWLFQVGMLLGEMQVKYYMKENLKDLNSNLKTFLADAPANVSPALMTKLADIAESLDNPQINDDADKGSVLDQQFQDIFEKLPMLGN